MTKIRHDRLANKSFAECKRNFEAGEYMTVNCEKVFAEKKEVCAKVSMTPFVPSKNRLERCRSIFAMQVAGLQRRIEATHASCIVVGVSGGLDSTLALLVSAQAVKNLGLPPETVTGITMPGFGTTKRTKSNSTTLMELLGCDIREISIVDSVRQHFADIGQDETVHDITYENCQARERTQILMDVANKEGGFVIGTGDLSELALGWCTYNGDHMSMYAVNTSIPKTLVRTLVDEVGHDMDRNGFPGIKDVIEDSEYLYSLIKKIKPNVLIAIDALASRRLSRLGCTIQISDTGISPGAGVGNNRTKLSQETLGIPVIGIGVPTVVDASTLALDLFDTEDVKFSEQLKSMVNPNGRQMVVTPKEIDLLINRASELIALAINYALHSDLNLSDLMSLMY